MAHPKRQHSSQRRRKRRTHDKLTVSTSIDLTKKGSQAGMSHRVCPITGFYKGQQIIDVTPRPKKTK